MNQRQRQTQQTEHLPRFSSQRQFAREKCHTEPALRYHDRCTDKITPTETRQHTLSSAEIFDELDDVMMTILEALLPTMYRTEVYC